ncbi:SAM-dependent tRNA/rRNA cytosine-C5 methylase [Archaeoglobales archaeon]|nr:MAG: SAM-dependent tRNA/rRNA cytosine-C5 methylase [Archaeoglobales archaeon]
MKIVDFPSTKKSRRLAEKYGYDEFIVRRWLNFFGDEAVNLIKAIENGLPKYIRINTIKIDEDRLLKKLNKRGFVLSKTDIPFCYMVKEEPYSIGATPEYLMGYYYVMDKSSCIPPLALNPKKGDVVVDFAASPGGKTTFISQLMGNRGVIIAIEANKERIQPLIDNVHRMGCLNIAILNMNAVKFNQLNIKVDKILLDAPCTGEGIIHKDKTRKVSRGKEDIEFCHSLQFDLIKSAFESLKKDGMLVYSTCSLTPEENEMVIDALLNEYNGKATVEEVDWGDEAFVSIPNTKIKFNKQLRKARRFYPHKHETSGFFVAKIRKLEG